MNNKEWEQKAKLANATLNAICSPTFENVSKFATELNKTDIEHSNLSDKEKEILKAWQDLGHELFTTRNYDKARSLYGYINGLLRN